MLFTEFAADTYNAFGSDLRLDCPYRGGTLMNILMAPVGSYGDVHPFVGLGKELTRRGHRVTVGAMAGFRDMIAQAGLGFVETTTEVEYKETIENPDFWNPRHSLALVARKMVEPALDRQYRFVREHADSGPTVVVAAGTGLGAFNAAEQLGLPLVGVALQPAVFWSQHQSPQLPGLLLPNWLPGWLKTLQFRLAVRLKVDGVLLTPFNRQRAEIGLPAKTSMFDLWSWPDRVMGMFPDWFAPPQQDWPATVRLSGFPLWDEPGDGLADEIREYLADGEPPIVFTAGSAMMHARSFFGAAVEACQLLGRRGILLAKFDEQIPTDLPRGVRHFSYVPFSRLLSHCAALVHHGGVGTTSQALAAGIPQVVVPMAFDQPDNAHRLQRLGVGDWLRSGRVSGGALAQQLQTLLDSEEVSRVAQDLAGRIGGESGLSTAAEIVIDSPRSRAG